MDDSENRLSRRKRNKPLLRRIGDGLLSVLTPIGAVWRLFTPGIRLLSRWLILIFWAIIGWFRRVNLRLLLQGLPALLVAIGVAIVTVMSVSATASNDLESRYLEEARAANRAGNHAAALVCYERLATMQKDRDDLLFEMALTAQAVGDGNRCGNLMRQLAPPNRRRYGKAHWWMALQLLAIPNPTSQARDLVEVHLQSALESGDVDRNVVHGLLGRVYLRRGLFQQAEEHFQFAVKTDGQYHLALMEVHQIQADRYAAGPQADPRLAQTHADRATSEGKLAVAFHAAAAKAKREDYLSRLKWAEALTRLNDFSQAIGVLEEGKAATANPVYSRAQAQVYAVWFDYLGRKGQGITAERLTLLEIGLSIDPDNGALLEKLLAISSLEREAVTQSRLAATAIGLGEPLPMVSMLAAGMATETARASLMGLLTRGKISSQVHFALGLDAWQRGQTEQARFHWEEAHKLNPNISRVANNLAWLLFQTAPKELDRALTLANLAVELDPRDTRCNDTRGRILAKMGKYREAVTDLEKALVRSPENPELHNLLGDAYAALNMSEIAESHRRLAAEIAGKKKAGR